MKKFVVVKVVTKRTGPSKTTFGKNTIPMGDIIEFSDIIEMENQQWGKIHGTQHGAENMQIEKTNLYSAIYVDGITYCVELKGAEEKRWQQAVDEFLRTKFDFDGPKP